MRETKEEERQKDGEGRSVSYKEYRMERETKGSGNTVQTWYKKG